MSGSSGGVRVPGSSRFDASHAVSPSSPFRRGLIGRLDADVGFVGSSGAPDTNGTPAEESSRLLAYVVSVVELLGALAHDHHRHDPRDEKKSQNSEHDQDCRSSLSQRGEKRERGVSSLLVKGFSQFENVRTIQNLNKFHIPFLLPLTCPFVPT